MLLAGCREYVPRAPDMTVKIPERKVEPSMLRTTKGEGIPRKEMSGRHGDLTVVEYDEERGGGYWKFRCRCGRNVSKQRNVVLRACAAGSPPKCSHVSLREGALRHADAAE